MRWTQWRICVPFVRIATRSSTGAFGRSQSTRRRRLSGSDSISPTLTGEQIGLYVPNTERTESCRLASPRVLRGASSRPRGTRAEEGDPQGAAFAEPTAPFPEDGV